MKPYKDPNDPNVKIEQHNKRITRLERRPFRADLIAAAYAPNPSEATYQFDAGVVPANTTVTVEWTYDVGDAALLDLTDPQFPVPVLQGVYTVEAEYDSPDATWTPGENITGNLEADGPLVNKAMQSSATFDLLSDPTNTRGFVSVTNRMTPVGTFKLDVANRGTIDHNLIGHISVQRILVY